MGSPHFFDYLINPYYFGISQNASKKNRIYICKRKNSTQEDFTKRKNTIMKFMPKSKSFHYLIFNSTFINEVEPVDWWKSQTIGNNDKSVLGMTQLFSAQAFASAERMIVIIWQLFYFLFSKLKENTHF